MKQININLKTILFVFSFSLLPTPVFAQSKTEETEAQEHLSPIRDALDFYFLEPARTIPAFFIESIDDVAEEAVKIAVLYVAYLKSPMRQWSRGMQFGILPVIYSVANLLGDFVDKAIERIQPGHEEKPHQTLLSDVFHKHDAVGKVIKDAVEDGVKISCYIIKFAKGFAPSMIWSQFVLRYDGQSRAVLFAARALKYYAYFAAATKMFGDANQCTRTSDQYGRWAEAQWEALGLR